MKSNDANGRHQALKRGLDEVIDAAENLLRATADDAVDEYGGVRKTLEAKVHAARTRIAEQAEDVAEGTRRIGAKGQRLVHENPWPSIGVGAAVGLVAGWLLARR